MLLNWDTKNVCIVSSQWHIRSTFGLFLSLFGVIVIAAGYEALRAASRKYELAVEKRVDTAPSESSFPSFPLPYNVTPPPSSPFLTRSSSVHAAATSHHNQHTLYYPCIHVSPFPLSRALEKDEDSMRGKDS